MKSLSKQEKKLTVFSADYITLRNKVRDTLLLGQRRIEEEKVRTYWRTGKLIDDFILKGSRYADKGKEVVSRLAGDLDVSTALLYQTVQFARAFPHLHARINVSWAHYRKLASVADDRTRERLLEQAEKENWTSRELEKKVVRANLIESKDSGKPEPLLPPPLGKFWTYRILDSESINAAHKDTLWLDLGFGVYLETERFENRGLRAGDIVRSAKDKKGSYSLSIVPGLGDADLFTYRGFVQRVIDGDTIKVRIDAGFGIWVREVIRLRGIDCPEIDTTAGKRAKTLVERRLKAEEFIALRTTRSDKYDRYLADIWAGKTYLNQNLIDKDLAVKMT